MNSSRFGSVPAGLDFLRVFLVRNWTDNPSATAGDGSLRGEVMAANNAGGGIVGFPPSFLSEIDLALLPPDSGGNYSNNPISITSSITIIGHGKLYDDFGSKVITINATQLFSVFSINTPPESTVQIFGLVIKQSIPFNPVPIYGVSANPAIINDSQSNLILDNNVFDRTVGAIYNGQGSTVSAKNCVFSSNIAISYTGIINNVGGTVNIERCCFSSNTGTVNSLGGAISNQRYSLPLPDSILNVSDSVFVDNSSNMLAAYGSGGGFGYGGAIFNSGTSTIDNCWFFYNSADFGGAIYSSNDSWAQLTLTNSVVIHNTAYQAIGGVSVAGNNYNSGTGNVFRDNLP